MSHMVKVTNRGTRLSVSEALPVHRPLLDPGIPKAEGELSLVHTM